MTKTERAAGVLARYHVKVNHPDYVKRKRGNPPHLIAAVVHLLGRKRCRHCQTIFDIELHHLDGNWRNYQLSNLDFYCFECHLHVAHGGCYRNKPVTPRFSHTGVVMTNRKQTRMQWTDTSNQKLFEYVNNHPSGSIQRACETLVREGADWYTSKAGPTYLEKRFYTYRAKVSGGSRSRKGVRSTKNGHDMAMQDAYEFYAFCRRYHINIISQ